MRLLDWRAAAAGCSMLFVLGCGQVAAPPQAEQASAGEGHRQMVELLAQIAEQADRDNPFFGRLGIDAARAELATNPSDASRRLMLHAYLGKNELRLGHNDAAVEHFLEANRLLAQLPDPAYDLRVHLLFDTAVAYIRLGESRNCVEHHTTESCILPIRGGGVHVDQEASRAAIEYLERTIEATRPDDLVRLRARWLLNISHMTLGSWPEGVAQRLRIDPEAFRSDQPFPRFVDIAPALRLNVLNLAGGAVADDFDGDGLLDLMISSMHTRGPARLFLNRGDEGFVERTKEAGLEGIVGGLNMVQADYDNDGDVDVLVLRGAWMGRHGRHPSSLLRNDGHAVFTDVTFAAGLGDAHYPTQTGAWGDYDGDGDLDLYVGNEHGRAFLVDEAAGPDAPAPSQLFRNDGDGTFTDVAAEAGVENLRYAKAVVWGDYDADRAPDLYVSNNGEPNRLYHNNGDGTFTDVAEELGVGLPISSFAAWFFDPNNDGALDLLVQAYGGPRFPVDVASVAGRFLGFEFPHELPKLYVNDGRGGFTERAQEWGIAEPTLPMGVNFGDLDNDGFVDFYLGTGYPGYEGLVPNVMYHNRDGKRFADVTFAGGFGHLQKGHGVAFADFDNDGDQDVFEEIGGAFAGDAYGNVFFENPGFGGHWIKIKLVGVRSNRSGIGARMRAVIDEPGRRRSVYMWVDSGGSFGANPLRKEIGLGRATRIAELEIDWPASGRTQRFTDVAADQAIEITEGRPDFAVLPLRRVTLGR